MATYQNYDTVVYENLKQMYRASADKWGEKALFLQKDKSTYKPISFRRYCEDVDALGTALLAKGYGGKKMMVCGDNCYAWALSYMAVICGVGVVVPVDKSLPAEELCRLAQLSGASVIFHSAKLTEKVSALPGEVERICFADLNALIAEGKRLIREGDHSYLSLRIDSHAMSALIFTSGTTGTPKGVMLSHRNICFSLSEMCQMIYVDERDTFLSILPFHYAYECMCGFLCPIYRGCTVAFGEGLRQLSKNLREVRPTVINCVPLILETMHEKVWANIRRQGMESKVRTRIVATNLVPTEKGRLAAKQKMFAKIHESFGGRLRMLVTGGASVNPAVLKGLRELGIATLQGYGLTECAPLAALNRDTFHNDRSAGLATPNSLIDIYDMQDDGTGEVRFKGDNIMLGYYQNPELTKEVIRDGWFYTGDLGYMDKEGFLYITGRKKNVIVTTGGRNVFPEELEMHLEKSPYVAEAVVVGYFDEARGDSDIVALVYPDYARIEELYGKQYTERQVENEIRKTVAEVNGSVQPHKHIDTYLLRKEEFPKNTSRKIVRAGLAEQAHEAYLKKLNRR